MNYKYILIFLLQTLILLSCKKQEVDEEEIEYQVSITNLKRPCTIKYVDENGKYQTEQLTNLNLSKSFMIESNAVKQEYTISVNCPKVNTGLEGNVNYEYQQIDLKIIEDGKIVASQILKGIEDLVLVDEEFQIILPTSVKYKKKK